MARQLSVPGSRKPGLFFAGDKADVFTVEPAPARRFAGIEGR